MENGNKTKFELLPSPSALCSSFSFLLFLVWLVLLWLVAGTMDKRMRAKEKKESLWTRKTVLRNKGG